MLWPARACLPVTACLAACAAAMLLVKQLLLSGDADAAEEGEEVQQEGAGCSTPTPASAGHASPAAHGLSQLAEEESAVWTDASSDAAGHAAGATPPSQQEGLSLQASESFISALSADDEAFDGAGSNTSSPQRPGKASSPSRQAPRQQHHQQLVAGPEQQHSSTPVPPPGGQQAPQHRRRSSDEQVVFEPVQPLLLDLGGLSLGGWQQQQQQAGDSGSSRASAADCSTRAPSNADRDAPASAKPGRGGQRDRTSWPDGLPSPRPQQQQQLLQPLNMAAAHAEGQAMTAEQWATVCTVAVGSQQGRAAWAAAARASSSGSNGPGSTPARFPSDVVPAGAAAGAATANDAAAGGKSSSSSEAADDLTSEDEADGVRRSSSVSSSTSASSSTSSGDGSGGGSSSMRALALPPDVAAGAGGGGGSSSAASHQRQQQASTTWAAAAAAATAGGQQPDGASGLRLRHSNSLQPGTLGDWPSLQVSGLSAVWPAAPDLTGGDAHGAAAKQQQHLPPPSPQRPTAQASGAQQQAQEGLQRLPSFAADLELQQQLADVLSPADAPQQQQQQPGAAKEPLVMEPTLLSTPPARSSSSSSGSIAAPPQANVAAHAGPKSSSSNVAAGAQQVAAVAAARAPQPAAVLLEAGSQRPSFGVVAGPPAAAGASSTPAAAVSAAAAAADDGSSRSAAGASGSSSAPWLRLVVSAGPAAGQQFQAAHGSKEFVIGRSPAAWASIPDAEVSGRHASLAWSDNANCWQLCDAGSLNGTFVNGLSISTPNRQPGCPTSLRHGDQLHLGSTTRARVECSSCGSSTGSSTGSDSAADAEAEAAALRAAAGGLQKQRLASRHRHGDTLEPDPAAAAVAAAHRSSLQKQQPSRLSLAPVAGAECRLPQQQQQQQAGKQQMLHTAAGSAADRFTTWHSDQRQQQPGTGGSSSSCAGTNQPPPPAAACGAGSSSGALLAPARPDGHLSPVILLQFLSCRVQGAVAKMVGADHRRNQCPCEDVVAWRTPLGDLAQLGLFCVFDGHHSRNASEQAQQLLPDLLAERLTARQQQQQPAGPQQQHSADLPQQPGQLQTCAPLVTQQQEQQQQQRLLEPGELHQQQHQQHQPPMLADEGAVAAALTASFLATDQQLTTDDGCTATALLLEGCPDGCVRLRVANVGDSMALLVDLGSAGWRCLTEDHRIAVNAGEAARITAKNALRPGVLQQRFYGLNIARMLGDRYLKEADVGFTAEPFVSEGVALGPCDEALLVVASDGLWDVVAQERAAALAAKAAGEATRAAGGGAAPGSSSSSGGSGGRRGVAAVVADELMQAALKLRSRDDISIMVLHVLPAATAADAAAAAAGGAAGRPPPGGSASGSM